MLGLEASNKRLLEPPDEGGEGIESIEIKKYLAFLINDCWLCQVPKHNGIPLPGKIGLLHLRF